MQLGNYSEEPAHKKGDIVYLKPSPNRTGEKSWPDIGSQYEIDCKVINVTREQEAIRELENGDMEYQYKHYYDIITGYGDIIDGLLEKNLVASKDKILYTKGLRVVIDKDTELCPKGTIFLVTNEWYSNEEIGIYIERKRGDALQLFIDYKP